MIYLKDEAAGVTVEDDGHSEACLSVNHRMNHHQSATLRPLSPKNFETFTK